MAAAITLGRPYAKAIFNVAKAANAQNIWFDILYILSVVGNSKRFADLVNNPNTNKHALMELIENIVFDASEKSLEQQKPLRNFMALLYDNGRLLLLSGIATVYNELLAAEAQSKAVSVMSAYSLDDAQRSRINTVLEKYFASTVELTYTEDINLIGGVLIRMGSWVMDGSIRGKLSKLTSDLMRG